MFKNEVISHFLVSLGYFLLVSLLRWKLDWGLVGLWLGAFLGTFLLDIDHFLYWYLHPEKEDSREVREIWGTRRTRGRRWIREIFAVLVKTHTTHLRLIFHTATFQVILLILAFYILSSGGSWFGSGLIMAINLHLLKDEWQEYLGGERERMVNWLFWQVKGLPVKKYLNLYLIGVTIAFLVLTVLLI